MSGSVHITNCADQEDEDKAEKIIKKFKTDLTETPKSASMLDIPREDILYTQLLPFLSIKDCFNLRSTGVSYRELVDSYFAQLKIINGKQLEYRDRQNFRPLQFEILVSNTKDVEEIVLPSCCSLTDDAFERFFMENSKLTKVDLSHCTGLRRRAFYPLASNSKNLIELHISCCQVDDGGIISLSYVATSLQILDVRLCPRLTDASMIAVSKLPSLRIFKIGNPRITDSTLLGVSENCSQLTELFVSQSRITDEGIMALDEGCPKLEYIFLLQCRHVTTLSLASLRKEIAVCIYNRRDNRRLNPNDVILDPAEDDLDSDSESFE